MAHRFPAIESGTGFVSTLQLFCQSADRSYRRHVVVGDNPVADGRYAVKDRGMRRQGNRWHNRTCIQGIASVFFQCVYKRMTAGFHGIRSESIDGDQYYFFIHM